MSKDSLEFQPLEALAFQSATLAKDLALKEVKRLTDEADRLQKELEQLRNAAKVLQEQTVTSYNEVVQFILKQNNKVVPPNKQVGILVDEKGKPTKLEWEI